MASTVDPFESVIHSFVIKIWLEEEECGRWRGHITHVTGNERRYVENLDEIDDFIAPYVKGMKASRSGWIRKWLEAHIGLRK